MSGILKLRILGVRAFDNHEPQELEFSSPLTLICGQNGVGKTTIIECLRYVTTGDLPPNAKGGAFVHDPRMSSEREVKAQVKLLFRNSGGHTMVAARNMRLSVTGKGTATFKTLEGYVKVQDKTLGDMGSLSSKCADLNVNIPLALGVPPAILNYVVFCHQEESLWPLAEPSVVKKRFDEIFEATKYTKALESLKVIRKEYLSNIKVEKVQVDHLTSDRQRANEKIQLAAELQDRIEELDRECEAKQNERVVKFEELNSIVEHSQRAQQLEYTVRDLERQYSRTSQDIEVFSSDIRDPLDSVETEAIAKELAESDTREGQLEQEVESLKVQRSHLESEVEGKRQHLALLANQRGRIEQLQDQNSKNINLREQMVSSALSAEQWLEARNAELAEVNEEIEDLELVHRKKEEELSQTISSAEAKRLQLKQVVADTRNSVRGFEMRIKELRDKIASFTDKDAGDNLSLVRTRLAELETEHSGAKSRLSEFEDGNALEAAKTAVRDAELKAEAARSAVQNAIDSSSAQARVQFLRDSQEESKTRMSSLQSQLREVAEQQNLKLEDSGDVSIEDLVADHMKTAEETRSDASRKLADLQIQLDSVNKAVTTLEAKQLFLEKSVATKTANLSDAALIDEYDNRVYEAENALISATEEQEQLQFAHSFFSRALQLAQNNEHPVCLLCDHEKTPDEAKTLASKLMSKMAALDVTPEEAEAETEARRAALDQLRSQKKDVDDIKQTQAEIAIIVKELEANRGTKLDLTAQIESTQRKLEAADKRVSELYALFKSTLHQLVLAKDENGEIERKLEMEMSISQAATDAVAQTPQEAQRVLETAETELKSARGEFERLRIDQERLKARVNSLSHGCQELRLRIGDLELKAARRQQAEDQLEKANDELRQAQTDHESALKEIPESESVIDDLQKQLRAKKHEHAQIERKSAETRNELMKAINEFNELTKKISMFEEEHGSDPLARLREEATGVESSITELQSRIGDITSRLGEVENLQTDFGSYRRNLNDNLRIRSLKTELDQISRELQNSKVELEAARSEVGKDYEERIRVLQEAVGDLNHQISTMSGESKALNAQLNQIHHELETSYNEVEDQYKRASAKLETSEGAADDLVKYIKALDSAIMQYHSLKMAEINALLDEMWKQTYTGTDVDTILIRSESDVGSASTRASYNYRVCMVKQDTELDMRGRCSAGQKVLASILIRMALAECFGSSSGLIVLDEPTTNLDRDNIESLAQSLSDIIASKRAQRNFQLIVITHDEHFLARMNPSDYCSYYYRITRDSRQLSRINKMPIASLH